MLSSCEVVYILSCNITCQEVTAVSIDKDEYRQRGRSKINGRQKKLAIRLAKNFVTRKRSKHIEIMFFFLKNQISMGKITLHTT